VCSPTIAARRGSEVDEAVAAWRRAGNACEFLTYTVPHCVGHSLSSSLGLLHDGYRSWSSGRAAIERRREHRIAGTIKAVEVTYGANGWHPHVHAVVFVRGAAWSPGERLQVLASLQATMSAHTRAAGRRALGFHGIDIRPVGAEGDGSLGQYLANVAGAGGSAGRELTAGMGKAARLGGATSWQLFSDAVEGEAAPIRLWREYEQATKGRSFVRWSAGLREAVGCAAPVLDEEAAVMAPAGDVLHVQTYTSRTWWAAVRSGRAAHLLEAVEAVARRRSAGVLAAHVRDPLTRCA